MVLKLLLCCFGGGGGGGYVAPAVAPAVEPPKESDKDVQDALSKERLLARKRRGRKSTILTGALGLADEKPQVKSLLGDV